MTLRFISASIAICGFLTVLMVETACAQTTSRDIKVAGMGTRKCSEWVEWKDGKNGEARALALEWAEGFISGHNVYARRGNEPMSSVVADTKVLIPLLDSYCQKNTDNRILNGVIEITQSLGGARINLTPRPTTPQVPAPRKKNEQES